MKYILPYIILVFAAFSCKKNNDPCGGNYTVNPKTPTSPTLASYKFRQNSYWVYQNDATAQLDSQVVVSENPGTIGSGGGTSCSSNSAEVYRIYVKSFLSNQTFTYTMLGYNWYKDTLLTAGGNWGKYIFSNVNPLYAGSEIQLVEIIPSMNLNGNNLTNVKKIFVNYAPGTYSYNLSNHNMYFYFADSIGVVKWEEVDGSSILESWSIRSWNTLL